MGKRLWTFVMPASGIRGDALPLSLGGLIPIELRGAWRGPEPFLSPERDAPPGMIPKPRGPGDLLPSPEEPRPAGRGEAPTTLALRAMEEIDALKERLVALVKRLDALEGRVSALEGKTA